MALLRFAEKWIHTSDLGMSTFAPQTVQAIALTSTMAAVARKNPSQTAGVVDVYTLEADGALTLIGPVTFECASASQALSLALDDQTLAVGVHGSDDSTQNAPPGSVRVYSVGDLTNAPQILDGQALKNQNSGGMWDTVAFGGSVALLGELLFVSEHRFYDGIGLVYVYQRVSGSYALLGHLPNPQVTYDATNIYYAGGVVSEMDCDFAKVVCANGESIVVTRPHRAVNNVSHLGTAYCYAPASLTAPDAAVPIETLAKQQPPMFMSFGWDGFGSNAALTRDWLAIQTASSVEVFKASAGGTWSQAATLPKLTLLALEGDHLVTGDASTNVMVHLLSKVHGPPWPFNVTHGPRDVSQQLPVHGAQAAIAGRVLLVADPTTGTVAQYLHEL